MFIQKRVVNGITYKYLDHSFRIGKKVKKVSFIINKNKQDYNEKIISRIAKEKAEYFKSNFQTYFSLKEITEIETEKLYHQIFYNLLDKKSKEEIFNEFLQLFLANSMELEGSTITPKLAESIDQKRKIVLPETEILLYNNSKKVLKKLLKTEFRSVSQFKQFHKEIYKKIFPHSGEFKTLTNTFGYTEKAKTTKPEDVKKELKKVLERYKDKKIYPFLKPLYFHLNYQKVHPFTDGNSRLGRILLIVQMFKLNYPPLMFKGDMSFQIRETLVDSINQNNLDFCRFSLEQYLSTAKKFWRPMIKKYLF